MTESISKDNCSDCGEHLELYPSDTPRPPCPKCGSIKRNRTVIVNERLVIKDSVSITVTLFFELKEKVYIGGNMTNASNIELVLDDDKNYLKGFLIKVLNTDDQSIKDATELANRFTNYLSIITRMPVSHKRPRIRKTQSGESTNTLSYTTDTLIVKNQELDVSKIYSFLSSDSRLHQHLNQAQTGLKALLDNNFAEAIKSFYMIIENQKSPESTRYLPLRNVVSHEELEYASTINGVATFGIIMKKGEHLNFNDPHVQDILEREAKNLMNIILPIVNNELKNI